MTKTFNIEMWEFLKTYKVDDKPFLKGKFFFGIAPEDVSAPYCVIHVLDSGMDSNSVTLCEDNVVYISDLQFSVYAINDMQLDEILHDLNKILKDVKKLDNYRVIYSNRMTTKTASYYTNEVGEGLTRFSFKYESL